MLKDMAKTAGILFAITFLVSLMLVVGNYFTKGRIEMRRELEEIAAKQQVLSDAAHFEDAFFDGLKDTEKLSVGYDKNNTAVVGFCVTTSAKGYGGEITVMTGIKLDKTIARIRILDHSETASVGSKAASNPALLLDHYIGRNGPFIVNKGKTADPNGIVAISGATVTSTAVNEAVNRAIELTELYMETWSQQAQEEVAEDA